MAENFNRAVQRNRQQMRSFTIFQNVVQSREWGRHSVKGVRAFVLAEQLVEAIPVHSFRILHVDVPERPIAFPQSGYFVEVWFHASG